MKVQLKGLRETASLLLDGVWVLIIAADNIMLYVMQYLTGLKFHIATLYPGLLEYSWLGGTNNTEIRE